MKHWDLVPGENVTLRSASGTTRRGYFLFRDTLRAAFMLEDAAKELHFREYRLADDGKIEAWTLTDLGQPARYVRTWFIMGQDRQTRTEL